MDDLHAVLIDIEEKQRLIDAIREEIDERKRWIEKHHSPVKIGDRVESKYQNHGKEFEVDRLHVSIVRLNPSDRYPDRCECRVEYKAFGSIVNKNGKLSKTLGGSRWFEGGTYDMPRPDDA